MRNIFPLLVSLIFFLGCVNPASDVYYFKDINQTGADSNQVKVSSNDTTAGYLNGKLVAGANITLTENNNGGNETLTIASTASGGGTDTNCSTSADCNSMYIQKNPIGSETIFHNNSEQLIISQDGNVSNSTSIGGAVLIENTDNNGAGLIIYSNAGSEANGRLLNIRADNTGFDQAPFHIDNDGTANTAEIVNNSTDTSAQALNVVSNNPNDTTLGINGVETSKGTLKIVHNVAGGDSSASAISIDLQGTGTQSQGIYLDSTASGGTTGDLLRLRNQTIDRFVVTKDGNAHSKGDINGLRLCINNDCRNTWPTSGGNGTTYTSGTPATIQVNNDTNTISQNFDGNFWALFAQGEPYIDGNALSVINGLDLNNSLSYLKTDTNCSTSTDCNSIYIQKNPLADQNINNQDLNIYNGQLVLHAGPNIAATSNNIFETWNQAGIRTTRLDQNGNLFIDGNFTCIDANCFIGGTTAAIGRRHYYNAYQYTANALTGGGNLWISANTYAFAVTGTATSGLYFDASAPRGFKYRIDGTDRFTVGAGSTNVDGSVWQTIRYADTIGQPDGTWSFRDLGFIDMNWQPYIRRNGVENHINAQVYLGTPINTTYATVLSGDGAYPLTGTDANWIGDMNMKGDMYFDANRFMIKSGKNVDSNVVLNLPSSTSAGMDVYADTSTEQLYYNTSDASMKTNIQDINQYIDYNKLNQLQPKCWNDIHNGKKGCGFIAQEVQQIFPQAVYTLPNGLLSIHYDYFNILLVEAIQKQMQINATTKAKLNQAEAFITAYCTTGGHSATPECQAVLNP